MCQGRGAASSSGGLLVEALDGARSDWSTKATSSTERKPSEVSSWPTDLVDVESAHEQLGAGLETRAWRTLRLFLLGEDCRCPAGELRGEADVLAAAADGEREAADRARRPRCARGPRRARPWRPQPGPARSPRGGDVRVPRNDVDPSRPAARRDRLDARAAHTDAGRTGSMEESRETTAILAREPGSRATALISTMPS